MLAIIPIAELRRALAYSSRRQRELAKAGLGPFSGCFFGPSSTIL